MNKKTMFILMGAGLVVSGIVTIILIYQGLSVGDVLVYQPLASETAGEMNKFNLEEIHSVSLAKHDHVLLTMLVDSQPAVVPEGIGMSPQL
ncbi:hypothetical protein Ngar_c18300 [Candidatus Nitrososphaera gargensis Ga9.2]|uniref:Uncharacterized protein n=1 Tax=Nitrososphaera gargensis (strain Ga9.2) TaxID=1237085 RepID=K0IIE1_NITGG|nr:hypothetical protein [Candidatus Nitrososphaera gargensis]AFU58763.1 hypothetical protein Ngar_c18300 [Candidatus Nitrososphaera gargensis Ga9.2]